jgi:hypothetical protein
LLGEGKKKREMAWGFFPRARGQTGFGGYASLDFHGY